MNFVELYSLPKVEFWVLAGLIVGLVIALVSAAFMHDKGSKRKEILLVVACVFGIILFVLSSAVGIIAGKARVAANADRAIFITSEMTETYGVTLNPGLITGSDFPDSKRNITYYEENLGYPEEKPELDFATFGDVTVKYLNDNNELVENRVTLVWVDEEMRLYGFEDETIGAELPRMNENKE